VEVDFVVGAVIEIGMQLTVTTNRGVGIPRGQVEGAVAEGFDCKRRGLDLLLCGLQLSDRCAGFSFGARGCSLGRREFSASRGGCGLVPKRCFPAWILT
jgi:hypothetical protein